MSSPINTGATVKPNVSLPTPQQTPSSVSTPNVGKVNTGADFKESLIPLETETSPGIAAQETDPDAVPPPVNDVLRQRTIEVKEIKLADKKEGDKQKVEEHKPNIDPASLLQTGQIPVTQDLPNITAPV